MSNNSVVDEESSVFSDSIVSLFSVASSKKNGDSNNSKNASFDKVIKLLLKQYPQAAQTPHGRTGRLPLVLADRAGHRTWNDGMKTLLRAYPPALFSGSKGMIPVKLYPYVLFACSMIGAITNLLWPLTAKRRAAQTAYLIDAIDEAVNELIANLR